MTAFVSVIVPVYNDREGILRCVSALRAQTYPAAQYEVIVVDNGSTPPLRLPEFDEALPKVIRAYEARPGSYAARNCGIGLSSGDVVAFTDADCAPDPDWIEKGVEALSAQQADLIAGRIEVTGDTPEPAGAVEMYSRLFGFSQEETARKGWAATANLFVARPVISKMGLFNDRLKSGEDSEWTKRATAAGFRLGYASEAIIRHPPRRTWSELYKRAVRLAGGRHAMALENGKGRLWLIAAALAQLRIPFQGLVRVRRAAAGLAILQQVQLVGVFGFLGLVRFWERWRLIWGGSPRRG